jgi:SAM-dependent methyltransferase
MDKNKTFRYLKYGFVAPALGAIIRQTSLLDGTSDEPPQIINFAGAGDFRKIGDQQVDLLVSRAGLTEEDRVLDVGCGIGRIAIAMHRRFPNLQYSGFDVVRYGIDWITKKFNSLKSYKFYHADVHNWLFRDLCGWAVFRSCEHGTRCCAVG